MRLFACVKGGKNEFEPTDYAGEGSGGRSIWVSLCHYRRGTVFIVPIKNFTADDDIDKLEIPLLGTNKKGFRDGTMTGKWSATLYYNTDKFREIAYKYRKTGVMTYFDLQITNADPNTAAGRHTVILKGCLLDKIPWAKLDIENKVLEEEVSGTYDDVEMPEKFAVLEGMLS